MYDPTIFGSLSSKPASGARSLGDFSRTSNPPPSGGGEWDPSQGVRETTLSVRFCSVTVGTPHSVTDLAKKLAMAPVFCNSEVDPPDTNRHLGQVGTPLFDRVYGPGGQADELFVEMQTRLVKRLCAFRGKAGVWKIVELALFGFVL